MRAPRVIFAVILLAVGISAQMTTSGSSSSSGGNQEIEPVLVPDQFGTAAPTPAGVIRDNVRGEMVNFETMMAKPIIVTSDGLEVVVANESDNRVVFLSPALNSIIAEVAVGQGLSALAERPGTQEIWATLRHQAGAVVIDRTTRTVTHLVRPPVASTSVGARSAGTPGAVVFDAGGTKAYIAASSTDEVLVFNAASKAWIKSIPLTGVHNNFTTAMNEPFAMTRINDNLVVASYRSGNNTLAERSNVLSGLPGPGSLATDLAGPLGQGRALPDYDLMVIDTTTDSVTSIKTGVGTVIHGLAGVSTASGDVLVVANQEARNGEIIGERAFPDGRVTFNRLAYVTLSGPMAGPHNHVITENLIPGTVRWVNIVQPTDIAVDASQRVYAAGYGSRNIGVFDVAGTFLGEIDAESGPLGLAYDGVNSALYCFNRAQPSVTRYDVSGALPTTWTAKFNLTDPQFTEVKLGRRNFLDPNHSAKGTASCASCHPHLRNDGVGWDLSKTYDVGTGYSVTSPPTMWKDRKGLMQTQDLRSLEELPGYHWRGEQRDIEDFNEAFVNLLHGTEQPERRFSTVKSYIFSAHYAANPFQMLNRDLSPDGTTGATAFVTDLEDGTRTCNDCHALPTGSDAGTTVNLVGLTGADLTTKSAQLRGMFDKLSATANIETDPLKPMKKAPVTGFGLIHTGDITSIENFMTAFFAGAVHKLELIEFLKEFDSGVAPAANWCEILDSSHPSAGSFLHAQAVAGNCDVAVRGWMLNLGVWKPVGWYLDLSQSPAVFVPSDSTIAPATLAQLQATVASGAAKWMLYGVPLDSGERIGVDRDRDAVYDDDEIALGTDPKKNDSDGDGMWDGYDPEPTNPMNTLFPVGAPTVTSLSVEWATTNSVKIVYTTSTFSPTRVEYGKSGGALDRTGGDTYPLGTFANNTSSVWKRRHVVFLRLIDAGAAYDFRILTQGQNGVLGQDILRTTSSMTDEFPVAMLVKSIDLTSSSTATDTTWTATVTLEDHDGLPVANSTVRGVFTTITAGVPTLQTTVAAGAVTDGLGMTTLTFVVPVQAAGDGMAFDVTMRVTSPTQPSVMNPAYQFKWPEGFVGGAKVIL